MTPDTPDKFEAAISRRLAKLGAMPVDTSHLERAVRAEIGDGRMGNLHLHDTMGCALATLALLLMLVVHKRFMALGGPQHSVAPE